MKNSINNLNSNSNPSHFKNCSCLQCMNKKRFLMEKNIFAPKKINLGQKKKTKKDEILEGIQFLKSKKNLTKKDKSNLEVLKVVLKSLG